MGFSEDSETGRQHKEFLGDMFIGMGLKIKAAASQINISAERLYKYLNESAGGNNLPAYLVPIITKCISPAYLQWLCAESGYSAIKLPEGDVDLGEALVAGSVAMKDCGNVLNSFSMAIKDGSVTPEELIDIKRRVRYANMSLLTIQATAEKMRVKVERNNRMNMDRF